MCLFTCPSSFLPVLTTIKNEGGASSKFKMCFKDTIKKTNRGTEERKFVQISYLIGHLYLQCIKNSYNSVKKNPHITIFKMGK